MNQQDASRIKELGLEALKNPNPNLRKEALLELRQYDTPIINDVFERVIQKDRDKAVRDLAQNLLTKRQILDVQRPAKPNLTQQSSTTLKTSGDRWKCSFCGSETNDPQNCPNCGAERKQSHDSVATKTVAGLDTFVVHPAHRDFVFGNSKSLNRNSLLGVGCLTSFLGIFFMFGIVFLGLALRDTYEWYAINQRGVAGTAHYIDRRISSDDDSDNYYVLFQYAHNGKDYLHEQQVNRDVYNHAEVGGNVQVVYVPSSPQTAKLAGTNSAPTAILLFGLFWNAIVFLVIFFAIRQARRVNFLAKNGKMLAGEILESTHSTDSDGDLSLKVEYTFQTPDANKRLTKVERVQRNDLKGQRPPAPGTPVVILYYDERRFMLL